MNHTRRNNAGHDVKLILIVIVVITAVIALGIFLVYSVQNRAISLEEQIAAAESEITVQQKRRGDLIPNLVDCVKAYDQHEYETLMAVVNARGTASDAAIEEVQTMIAAVAEAYPELQSSANYRELMNELSTTENMIANYRSSFNKWVRTYKQFVRKFPNAPILSMLGYEIIDYGYLEFDASEDAPTDLFGDVA